VLLGRERRTIRASGRPLAASMAILDRHLPTYVQEMERRLNQQEAT
jgi:hypothetical protein